MTQPDPPGSPLWWMKRLYEQLQSQREYFELMDAYYRGEPPRYPWLPAQAQTEFRRLLKLTKSNYMGLVVDSMVERMQVEGFRVGDLPDADKDTWAIWQANNLDSGSDQVLLESAIGGCAFFLVAPNATDQARPLIFPEHPSQATVAYEPGTSRRVRAAGLKVWSDDWTGRTMATLYLPDKLYKFSAEKVSPGTGGKPRWEPREVRGERWPASNPLGEVPLVEVANNPRMLTGGVSEIADVVSIQDRIAKTLADRLMTQDFGAFPQKWAAGFPAEDGQGNATQVDIGRDRMVTSDAAETRFGQWDAAPLDPYSAAKREDVKDIASRTRTPAQYLLGEMSNVNGEALALDTPIPTPRGLVPIGDIRDGDQIYDERGQVQTVTHAHPVLHDRACYRVTFDDGAEIIADAGHRWPVRSVAEHQRTLRGRVQRTVETVMTTEDIARSVKCANGQWTHAIDLALPADGPEIDLPVDPYVMGVYLGDGCKTDGMIASGDDDLEAMIELLVRAGERPTWKRRRTVNQITCHKPNPDACANGHTGRTNPRNGVCRECDLQRWHLKAHGIARSGVANQSLRGRLVAAGVLGDKHIPEAYFRASFKQRLALLQGVMDADGTANRLHPGSVELSLSDERLARDAYRLICSLGHKTSLRSNRATGFGGQPGVTRRWRMIWKPLDVVFRLPRKVETQSANPTLMRPKELRRAITAVEPAPSVPVRCLTVSGESHLYLVGVQHIPTHNTLKASESGLVSKVRQRHRTSGEGIEDTGRLARKAAGIGGGDEAMETIWRNPEFRTEGELVDALTKMSMLNVPDEALWERWGASQTEIQRWKQMRAEQDLLDPIGALTRAAGQRGPVDVPGASGDPGTPPEIG